MRKSILALFWILLSVSFLTGEAEARRRHHVVRSLPAADVKIYIDVSSQALSVNVRGSHVASYPVSTARRGFYTPRGSWRVTRLKRMHYSTQYNNAAMPHSIFFVGGVAIHATKGVGKLGTPASHGCVRLSPSHAAQLFALVSRYGAKRTQVTVAN